MEIKFFVKQADFRKWLEKNHDKKTELIVGFYNVGSGKPSITWTQSVDEALRFGWIDGVRRGIDEESYCIRFTPRKPNSNWSAINIAKVEKLTKEDLMKPAGLAAFERRKEHKSCVYAYENEPAALSPAFQKRFKANKAAWKFFTTQAPSYQRTIIHWIMRAKQQSTQTKRLEQTISASSESKRIA